MPFDHEENPMGYSRTAGISSWRRFALAAWRPPNDPTIYGMMQFDVTRALKRIQSIREKTGAKVTIPTIVGQGLAIGVAADPDTNCKVIWRRPYQKDKVVVAYQVAVEGGKDLALWDIEEPQTKSLVRVATELADGARKIRAGEDKQFSKTQKMLGILPSVILGLILRFLSFMIYNIGLPPRVLGARPFASCMVTNVGSFGIDVAFVPLVPFSRVPMILSVGEVFDGVMAVQGRAEVRKMVTLTGTFDHRLVDGVHAGKLIAAMKKHLAELPEEATEDDLRDAALLASETTKKVTASAIAAPEGARTGA
jgi:pyruvate dehydrogenase E2 component (dihydrolipoamide acetyltransferase)